MNKPFIKIDPEYFPPSEFETKPIEGYEAPTNKETGEQFPNCCPFHKNVFEGAESWFSKFPNCCDQHKAMVSKWWYNKANYSGIAEKIVKQLSYTEHHISERININDWYKDITDYIEYNVSSFGNPQIGSHLYLDNIQYYIKNTNSEIPKNKRQRLIEFIETYYNSPKEQTKTDLNILYSTYQKWLKVFPFEISFFSTLKPHFEKQLPILNGKPETNKYTGTAKVKIHTKGSLIDFLLNLTNNLLTQINTTTLYEKGLLTEPQKIKLELVLNERKMKLKQGYVNSSKDEEQRYRKILKEWFADEKRFIDEVTPIVKALPPQLIAGQKPELKINQIALKYAYEGLQITRENGNNIAKEYGHNSGEKLFQRFTYFSSSANRKGKPNLCTPKKLDNKIKLIESIIELLPTDKQERAKDEVSILKKIYEAEYQ